MIPCTWLMGRGRTTTMMMRIDGLCRVGVRVLDFACMLYAGLT